MRKVDYEKGQRIGHWTVLEETRVNGKRCYHVRCDCGIERDIAPYILHAGRSTGCESCSRIGRGEDLTGRRFGHLIAEERVVANKRTCYRCTCDCGGSIVVQANRLRGGRVVTCGCRMGAGEKIWEKISPHYENGTYLSSHTQKISKNNTSGVKGVSYRADRGKYRAYIKFQRKNIFLGNYDNIEDAIAARKAGEKKYFGNGSIAETEAIT